jgi:hypothetical protein
MPHTSNPEVNYCSLCITGSAGSTISSTDLLHRVDHLHSALTETCPRFIMDNAPEEQLGSQPGLSLIHSSGPVRGIGNPTLLDVLNQLCEASQFLENLVDPVSEEDFFSFSIKRVRIEQKLFRLGTIGDALQPLSPTSQCCRAAALLYVQTALTKVNCKVYHDLCTAIRYSIEQIGLESLQLENADLLLWMLLVGGGAAPFNADRPWFMRALERNLHTSLWEEVEQRLQGWPWRPRYCVPWRAIWREAITMGGEL